MAQDPKAEDKVVEVNRTMRMSKETAKGSVNNKVKSILSTFKSSKNFYNGLITFIKKGQDRNINANELQIIKLENIDSSNVEIDCIESKYKYNISVNMKQYGKYGVFDFHT